jgi:AraC-like DNA-binding protein
MLSGIEDGKRASKRRSHRSARCFRIDVPIAALTKALAGKLDRSFGQFERGGDRNRHAGFLIPFSREFEAVDVWADGKVLGVLPFPDGVIALARLLDADELGDDASPCTSMFIERGVFDRLADEYGYDPIEHLKIVRDGRRHPILRNLSECLEDDAGGNDDLDRAYIEHIVRAITIYLVAEFGGFTFSPGPDQGGLQPWQLRLARKNLAKGFATSVSLREVAGSCGLSLSHFSRAFRQSTGFSPHRWLRERRIQIAKRMMRVTDEPLAEIAAACGFSDQSHLNRVFTSVVGITPNRWRLAAAPGSPGNGG